jgi:hypothetical protein
MHVSGSGLTTACRRPASLLLRYRSAQDAAQPAADAHFGPPTYASIEVQNAVFESET